MPKKTEQKRFQPGNQSLSRAADLTPSSYDEGSRSVEAILSTGSRVRRWYDFEELEISDAAIDLSRAAGGQVKLLDHHNQFERNAILGTVSDVRVENGQLVGLLTFADSDAGREAEGQVQRGELSSVSIGYKVDSWERTGVEDDREIWTARKWELLEVSLVSVPADPSANIRSLPQGEPIETPENEDGDMPKQTDNQRAGQSANQDPVNGGDPATDVATRGAQNEPAAPVQSERSAATIDYICGQAEASGLGMDWVRSMGGRSEQEVRDAALNALQARTSAPTNGTHNESTLDNPANMRGALIDALASRAAGSQPSDQARQFTSYSIVDVAATSMGERATFGRNDVDIIQRALTTGDFPLILEGVNHQLMRREYDRAAPTYREIMRRSDLQDFKASSSYSLGDFPTLKQVTEKGEIDFGGISEGKETSQLKTFGRRVSITRQMLINDNLGAFADIGRRAAQAVLLFENGLAYKILLSNGGNGPKLSDGKALFDDAHKNLLAAAALGVDGVSAARKAMRQQESLDKQRLSIPAKKLLVGPDLETKAEMFLAQVTPTKQADFNPFSGKLELVVESEIIDKSWRLFANPEMYDVMTYGYLRQNPGPIFMRNQSSPVDGVELVVVLDFHVSASDFRGAVKNPGQ
ncbi:phage prohead protease, HK97 family [Cohaesibacter marisflavi]|uniref:Phage prohead protease, HK97 family n=1 Tax=Cohaesibacter marisflavi TaxID=655353 RepID=A0A1I5HAZ4_9HYPH|nr:prohead protease/major capsid protein fusion protein [Cohaesibacter marisflavi]SFO45393.1 phage prohead protease, HK97 family [Cohaesibacter marisflavi]